MSRQKFAEIYVAGFLANLKWDIYIPYSDNGWDFIISKKINVNGKPVEIFRPVQVKGKYPTGKAKNYKRYGFRGKLSKVHDDMVLAIPFYPSLKIDIPSMIAFLPKGRLSCSPSKYYTGAPCSYKKSNIIIDNNYRHLFDTPGVKLIEDIHWQNK